MEYEGRGKNLKKSDVGCSLKKRESKKEKQEKKEAEYKFEFNATERALLAVI